LTDAIAKIWLRRLQEAGPAPQSRGGDLVGGPMPSDLIEGYELLAEMGRGGQGVVFRALQMPTSRLVALKLLHEGPVASPASVRRFQREVELTSSLDHPGIMTVFDAGVSTDGRRYVVSKIVEGQPLDQWLEDQRPGFDQRIDVMLQLCRALEHAHQRGVIHLDLKPSNVLVTDTGQACILDFGMARLLEQSASQTLSEGITAGTPAYMAPEQISKGPADWDTRTDVHALGVLLFQVLLEDLPFAADGPPLEVLRAIESAPPPRLRSRLQLDVLTFDLPSIERMRDLEAICTQAMAKEPDLRYANANEMAADLCAMREGQRVSARGMDRAYRLRLALRRNRPAIALTLASLMIAVWFGWTAKVQKNLSAEALASRDQARQAAFAFINEVDPLIKTLPGSAPARQAIVIRGLEFLEHLSAQVRSDPQLAASLASGYFLMGNIQADLYSSSSGDLEAALQSYQKGLDLLGNLAPIQDHPSAENLSLQFELLRKRGQVLRRLSRWEELGTGVQREMQLAQSLVDRFPDNPNHQRILALALEDKGLWVEHEGRLEESFDLQIQSQNILEGLVARTNDLDLLQRDLAVGYFKIGQSLRALDRLDEAHRQFLKFLAYAPTGDDLLAQADRAIAHEWVGRIEFQRGNSASALDHLNQAISTLDDLLLEHQDNLNLRTSLATILNHSGEIHLASGDFELAQTAFTRFAETAQSLTDDFPKVPRNHRLLGVSYYKFFELHSARADLYAEASTEHKSTQELARTALGRCIEVFESMQAQNLLAPEDAGVIGDLRRELAAQS
jgi:eukaryotic-like serine/threonine-protein kinase